VVNRHGADDPLSRISVLAASRFAASLSFHRHDAMGAKDRGGA